MFIMRPEFNFFGENAKFNHIGIAVSSIKELSPESELTKDEIQKVYVSFVSLNGVAVELIEPLNDDSPVALSIEKGIKLVHICYKVSDIERALKKCREHGFKCIAEPQPASAFNNQKIAWVYSKHYGLFELLEND